MEYAINSMYSVCIEHALRYFKREQFLFLRRAPHSPTCSRVALVQLASLGRYEDLMRMNAKSIITLLARFTGVHLDPATLRAGMASGKCQPHGRSKPMSYSRHSRCETIATRVSRP